jgi:hypothetical protein
VLLHARLGNVARIIERVLTTIDENPQIVERLVESAATAAPSETSSRSPRGRARD